MSASFIIIFFAFDGTQTGDSSPPPRLPGGWVVGGEGGAITDRNPGGWRGDPSRPVGDPKLWEEIGQHCLGHRGRAHGGGEGRRRGNFRHFLRSSFPRGMDDIDGTCSSRFIPISHLAAGRGRVAGEYGIVEIALKNTKSSGDKKFNKIDRIYSILLPPPLWCNATARGMLVACLTIMPHLSFSGCCAVGGQVGNVEGSQGNSRW